jgi:hypothetical protein
MHENALPATIPGHSCIHLPYVDSPLGGHGTENIQPKTGFQGFPPHQLRILAKYN